MKKISTFISLHETLCKWMFQMPKSFVLLLFWVFFCLFLVFSRKSGRKLIYAESISGAALIFTMCLNFVHTLQFNFKYGFRPAFPSSLQHILLFVFFLPDTFKIWISKHWHSGCDLSADPCLGGWKMCCGGDAWKGSAICRGVNLCHGTRHADRQMCFNCISWKKPKGSPRDQRGSCVFKHRASSSCKTSTY